MISREFLLSKLKTALEKDKQANPEIMISCNSEDEFYQRLIWKKGYKAYLCSERWETLREQKNRQVNYRDQLTNRKGDIQYHHRTYAHIGKEVEIEDIVGLPKAIHNTFHKQFSYDQETHQFK